MRDPSRRGLPSRPGTGAPPDSYPRRVRSETSDLVGATRNAGSSAWLSGPIETAYRIVPRPATPPSSRPIAKTVSSIRVRTRRSDRPVRRASPVISPSRGPRPNCAPMYAAVATPCRTMPATSQEIAHAHRVRPRHDGQEDVGGQADHEGVRDRPEPGHLAERDPGQHHHEADDHQRLPDVDREVLGQAGVQHVPRRQAEVGADHQRDREPVQHQADVELHEPTGQPARAQLRDRAELAQDERRRGGGRGHRTSVPRDWTPHQEPIVREWPA